MFNERMLQGESQEANRTHQEQRHTAGLLDNRKRNAGHREIELVRR